MTGFILWLVVGGIAGVAGRVLLPGRRAGWVVSILTGLVGGVVGGAAATLMDMGGIAELDLRAGAVALLTASLLVILLQLFRARRG